MNTQSLSTNININYALKNIIKIIKNIKRHYNFSNKETNLKLGLSSPNVKSDHIVSYSVKYILDDYIYEEINIDIAKLNIKDNLLIIYKNIIDILQHTNGIIQAELSKKLQINSNYDINNWITYLFVELLNDLKIISYIKKKNKIIFLTNDTNININKYSEYSYFHQMD